MLGVQPLDIGMGGANKSVHALLLFMERVHLRLKKKKGEGGAFVSCVCRVCVVCVSCMCRVYVCRVCVCVCVSCMCRVCVCVSCMCVTCVWAGGTDSLHHTRWHACTTHLDSID